MYASQNSRFTTLNSHFDFPSVGFRKFITLAAILLAVIFSATVSASDGLLTVVTNPPSSGTITGAGTYQTGTYASSVITAKDGWYIQAIQFTGLPSPVIGGRIFLNPTEIFAKFMTLNRQGDPNFDPTTVTEYTMPVFIQSDCTNEVVFAPLAPTFGNALSDQFVLAGANIELSASAGGRNPITFQWQKDGTDISGQTSSTLTRSAITVAQAGEYTLVASNAFGVSTSSAKVVVRELLVYADNVLVKGATISPLGQVNVRFDSINGSSRIFYTTDGTDPTLSSTQYEGMFVISKSCPLRARAYTSNFIQSVASEPIQITVLPGYRVITYGGGGHVFVEPSLDLYPENSTVTMTAVADAGWTFMNWNSDATGTTPTITVTVTHDTYAEAVFGTPFNVVSSANGTASLKPNVSLFPYGGLVYLTARPSPGFSFNRWLGLAENINPTFHRVTEPNVTALARFAALPDNQAALTVISEGGGSTSFKSPPYAKNETIAITAVPLPGQTFLGWSGDASGTQNPLALSLDANKTITAEFSRNSLLSIESDSDGVIELDLRGILGDAYRVETSADFVTWTPFATLTNFFESAIWIDRSATSSVKVYRAVKF